MAVLGALQAEVPMSGHVKPARLTLDSEALGSQRGFGSRKKSREEREE